MSRDVLFIICMFVSFNNESLVLFIVQQVSSRVETPVEESVVMNLNITANTTSYPETDELVRIAQEVHTTRSSMSDTPEHALHPASKVRHQHFILPVCSGIVVLI